MAATNIFSYWGKTSKESDDSWHPLVLHNLDVAAVSVAIFDADRVLGSRMAAMFPLPRDQVRSLVAFVAAIHDLGKFSLPFQNKRPDLAHAAGLKGWGASYSRRRDHHTHLGMRLWEAWVDDFAENASLEDGDLFNPLAEAAFGHHGEPVHGDLPPMGFDTGIRQDAHAWLDLAASLFLQGGLPGFSPVRFDPMWDEHTFVPASWLTAGLLVLADWVGSNDRWFPLEHGKPSLAAYWDSACGKASAALRDTRILAAAPSSARDFHDLLPHLKSTLSPRPLQQAVLDLPKQAGPELVILEDLTGSGKTEAAILCAHRAMRAGLSAGLFVGLPTMATANAMYARLSDSYRALFASPEASLVVAHGARLLNRKFMGSIEPLAPLGLEAPPPRPQRMEDSAATCGAWIADNRKKALLAPCGVGTLDQALLAVLPSRHQSLRLLGLARSVLIADEIHAYDDYTSNLLEQLIRFHAAHGGSVVLLSATLPHAVRGRFLRAWGEGRTEAEAKTGVDAGADVDLPAEQGFPLMTRATDQGVLAVPVAAYRGLDVTVTPRHDPGEMFETLVEAHRDGACACWIRNTVDDALAARRELVEVHGLPEEAVVLFHARFAGCDRADTEGRVLRLFGKDSTPGDRAGRILVATQVVEQSLDLDFDLMLSDLAPMELVIQRAGRCHRHDRPRPAGYEAPRLHVLMPPPEDEADAHWYERMFDQGRWVYPNHAELWRTARLLRDKGRLLLPEQARELVETAHGGQAPQALKDKDDEALKDRSAERARAGFAALDYGDGYTRGEGGMKWDVDVRTPTRLGVETRQVRLVRVEGEALRLWSVKEGGSTGMAACMASEIRVSARKLAEAVVPPELRDRLEAFAGTMPDQARWAELLPLTPTDGGLWTARIRDGQGDEGSVFYGPDGLGFDEGAKL